jgi:hypothetical protein
MTRHRNPRPRLPKRPPQDNLNDLLDLLRAHVARADALLTAAEDLIERPSPGTDALVDEDADDHPGRRRNHIAYLLDAAKLAVRAAIYTSTEIDRQRGA